MTKTRSIGNFCFSQDNKKKIDKSIISRIEKLLLGNLW